MDSPDMKNPGVLIRADASPAIGTGHVMRCLALAQAWQDSGGRVAFAMAETTAAIERRLIAESCLVFPIAPRAGTQEDSRRAAALAAEQKAQWVVVDGYQFGAEYQEALKAAGFRVLVLEDYGHSGRYSADLVLDQSVCADRSLYENRSPNTRLLLGPRYCLLRREFVTGRPGERDIRPQAQRVLVTMGGSDPGNLTACAIEALGLTDVERLEVKVVVGGSNPRYELLRQLAEKLRPRPGIKITVQADVADMAELMTWADVAISAAGSTCWELCLSGLPSLLIDAAANQTALARELDRLGCAIHLGGPREASAAKIAEELGRLARSPELRRSLSQRSRRLVDGHGARRVVAALRHGLRLRKAQKEDARLLWEWANDPVVRANSFASEPIPWETHVVWFAKKLDQDGCVLLIAEDQKGTPLGQIRFDASRDGEMYVNLSVAKEQRGQGLAALLIETGVEEAFGRPGCNRIHALVKPENAASLKAFEAAGFIRSGVEQVRGNPAAHFVYDRQ